MAFISRLPYLGSDKGPATKRQKPEQSSLNPHNKDKEPRTTDREGHVQRGFYRLTPAASDDRILNVSCESLLRTEI